MSEKHYISRAILNIKDVNEIIAEGRPLALSEEALAGLKGKRYLDGKLKPPLNLFMESIQVLDLCVM